MTSKFHAYHCNAAKRFGNPVSLIALILPCLWLVIECLLWPVYCSIKNALHTFISLALPFLTLTKFNSKEKTSFEYVLQLLTVTLKICIDHILFYPHVHIITCKFSLLIIMTKLTRILVPSFLNGFL